MMRWWVLALVIAIVLVIQSNTGGWLTVGAQPVTVDWLLIVALTIAWRNESGDGALACWLLGLAKDLTSDAVLGSYACSFALMALVVIGLRDFLGRRPTAVLMALTFAAGLLVEHVALVAEAVRGDLSGSAYRVLWPTLLTNSLLTALLAPYGQWVLMLLERPLGLSSHRR